MSSDKKPEDKPGANENSVKPQVIDLQAEDVTVADPAGTESPPDDAGRPAPPTSKTKSGAGKWIALALALGLGAGGWAYRDLLSGYLPSDAMLALQSRVDVLEANGRTQTEQLVAIDQTAAAARKAAEGLDQAVKDAAATAGQAGADIAGLGDRLAAQDKAIAQLRGDLDALRTAASSGNGGGPVDSAALVALGQRIDALEKDMASLKSKGGSGDADATAALSQALSDLKAKVAAGVPYNAEYERVARMVPAAPGLDGLALNADAGLPDAAGLAAELRAAIPSLPAPATATDPQEESYFDWAWDLLSGVVTIRDIGDTDWRLVAEKSASLAEAGDLPQAIDLIDAAEGAKPAAIANWRDRVAGRLALIKALNETEEAVLRQLAAQGKTP